jgi:hypothetical protein
LRYADQRGKPPLSIILDAPFYIVCEGSADAAFLDELLRQRGLLDQTFYVREIEGIRQLERHLTALQGSTSRSKLTHLAVVVDADLAPSNRFLGVRTALTSAQLPCPRGPFVIEKNDPSVGVWLMPGNNSQGNLETLLADAALQNNASNKRCIDAFEQCMQNTGSWDVGKKSKMRISALVAGVCEEDPSCSLAYVWGKASNPIPLTSSHFDALANFLINLSKI